MKIRAIEATRQGLEIIINNPIIAAIVVFYGIFHSIFVYFSVYAPELVYASGQGMPSPELSGLLVFYTFLYILVSIFLSLVICKMVYDAVKDRASFDEAASVSARRFIFIVVASILYFLMLAVGFVALIIPGIFLLIKFAFFSYAILLDNENIINSFKKSWQITKGNWWRVAGLLSIFVIPIMILSVAAALMADVSIQTALIVDFISVLITGWFISAFTIAYIQLTNKHE